MRALRAVKEIFFLGRFGFFGRGVGVWVRHFGCATVPAGRVYVPCVDQGGQRRGEEDVSFGLLFFFRLQRNEGRGGGMLKRTEGDRYP